MPQFLRPDTHIADRRPPRFFGAVDIRCRRSGFRLEYRQFEPLAFPLQEPELLAEKQVLFAKLPDQEYVGTTYALTSSSRSGLTSS